MLLQMALFHSFLWLSPSYTYYIIFTHSSVEGHLGCFHFLTIVISAVMNIGVFVSFLIKILIFLDIRPGVKLLDHMLLLLFSRSVVQSCLILCNPMDCNTLGFPDPHRLPEDHMQEPACCFPQWMDRFTFPPIV